MRLVSPVSLLFVLSVFLLTGCQSLLKPATPELAGTAWQVSDVQGEPFRSPDNVPYTLMLEASGHVRAFMGCNDINGDYQQHGSSLRVGPQLATHRSCPDTAIKQERMLIRAMEGASSFVLQADGLSLRNPIGITLIRFRPDAAAQKTAMP